MVAIESQSLNDLYLLIGRLEGKVDRVLVEQQSIKEMASNNNTRIQRLEKDRAMVYGAAAVLGVVGSVVIWLITKFTGNP